MSKSDKPAVVKLSIPFTDDVLKRINSIADFHSNYFQSIFSYTHNNFEIDVLLEEFKETPLEYIKCLGAAQVESLFVRCSALFYLERELEPGIIDFSRIRVLPDGTFRFPFRMTSSDEDETTAAPLICLFRGNPHMKDLDETNHRAVFERLVRQYTFDRREAFVYRFNQFNSHYLTTFPITELKRETNIKIKIKTTEPGQESVIKRHLLRKFQSPEIFLVDASGLSHNLPQFMAQCLSDRFLYSADDPAAFIDKLNRWLQESAYQSFVLLVDHLKSNEDAQFVNFLLHSSGISCIVLVAFNTTHDFLEFDLVINETAPNLLGDYLILDKTGGKPRPLNRGATGTANIDAASLPDDAGNSRFRLEELIRDDESAPAEMLIHNHIDRNPESRVFFKLKLARIYRVLRDYPRMCAILDEIKDNIPESLMDEFYYLNFIYYDNTSDVKKADGYLREIKAPFFLHLARVKLSDRYIYGGKYQEARAMLSEAVDFFRRENYVRDELDALNQLAKLLRSIQKFAEAETLYKNIFIRSGMKGFPLLSAFIAVDLGNLYYIMDDFDRAESWYKKALAIFQRRKDKTGILLVQSNLADIYKFKGDWQTSRNYLKSSLAHSNERKSATSSAIDYYNIAELEYLKHNETAAREYLQKAVQIFKRKKDVDHMVECELLKLRLDFLFPPRGQGKEKRTVDVKEVQKYRKHLSPDQRVLLWIFYALKSGKVPPGKQSLVKERIDQLKSPRLRFEMVSLLLLSGEMPDLLEPLKELSRRLSRKSRNYYYYEYFYIYFTMIHNSHGAHSSSLPPEGQDLLDGQVDIFMEMYYFFLRNKRRLSYRIKKIKERLDEQDSVYDVFRNAELVGDYAHWKVPGDFFDSLVKELKKVVPADLVKLVIYENNAPVFDFSTDTLFGKLTGEIISQTLHRLENVNHRLEQVKRLYKSQEKAFYPYRNTKAFLWKISRTLSGVLLLGFQSAEYYNYNFYERGRKLLNTFASLIDTYYEKDYRLNEKLNFIIGESPAMKMLKQRILKVGKVPFSLLIRGESGSGKELVARGIHLLSSRSGKPFIPVNAAAIPENLLEAELFGYKKGAFTGAVTGKTGLIESAHGGTLFLDEIADLPLSLQAKMLRVLQENEIRRLGETHTVAVDFRLISATNKNLENMMAENRFREDLYFRLQDLTLDVPSLEERVEDIPLLARHFLAKYNFSPENESELQRIVDYLKYRSWPGNVRELESFVKRLITYYPDFEMETAIEHKPQIGLIAARENMERDLIRNALVDHDWNQLRTAKALKISRPYLVNRMEKYRLKKSDEIRTNGT